MHAGRTHTASDRSNRGRAVRHGHSSAAVSRSRDRARHHRRRAAITALAIAASGLGLTACVTDEQAAAIRAQLDENKARLDESIKQQQASLDGLAADDPARTAAADRVARAKLQRDAMDAAARQIDLAQRTADDPAGAIEALGGLAGGAGGGSGASGIIPFLPPAAQLPIALGAGLLAALLRARKMKTALTSVAKGLDAAMKDDPDFKKKFQENATTFRATQSPLAARVIDEATKDQFMVRLPI